MISFRFAFNYIVAFTGVRRERKFLASGKFCKRETFFDVKKTHSGIISFLLAPRTSSEGSERKTNISLLAVVALLLHLLNKAEGFIFSVIFKFQRRGYFTKDVSVKLSNNILLTKLL